ncbi:SdpI family protein [Ornithobacterium rhinotracheale]
MIKYLLIFDLALVGLPLLMYLFPPKELNAIYGYRTKRASRDQASWDFAQRYALKRLLIVALIALFSQFILLIAGFSYMAGFFVLQNSLLFSNSFYCVGGVGALMPLAPFYPFLFIKWIFVVKFVKHENKSVKSLIIKYI